jgi:PIN domain-containing protein
MRTQFVLLDFENVQPEDLALLNNGDLAVKVFLGTNQNKIPLELAQALQTLGSAAEYIKIVGNGKNALDFHIAYYIGRLATETPGATFRIISKDTGFDPLLKHLEAKGIQCRRSTSIGALFPPDLSRIGSIPEMAKAIIDDLVKRKSAKPKTLKKLRSTIKARLGNQCGDQEIDELIQLLTKRGVLGIIDGKVHYELSS